MRCKNLNEIHQILLLRQGPVHELEIELCDDCGFLDLDQIILHLVKNHKIEKLNFNKCQSDLYNIPISVFSLHHLTDLDLSHVDLDHQPIFNGFGSLKSLVLFNVRISSKSLLHLLSNCPSLKSFTLLVGDGHTGHDGCTIIQLFNSLPVIEYLRIFASVDNWLYLDSIEQELPSKLFHLKYFCYEEMYFCGGHALMFLLVLIKCSPNLENISLELVNDTSDEEYPVVWEDYPDVWLEHLSELSIYGLKNFKSEMEFVKFILARSPKLKKVAIYNQFKGDHEENSVVWEECSDVWLEHLDELEIGSFKNTKPEMEYVKFILARSPKLKKMTFKGTEVYNVIEKMKMLEVLLSAPRASPVRIMFETY